MTNIGTQITVLFTLVAGAAGSWFGSDSETRETPPQRTALVIDASAGRDGRELVDPRLRGLDADVRLPRTAEEARTNVRYFAALGHRLIVVGPRADAAARTAGADAVRASGIAAALRAAGS